MRTAEHPSADGAETVGTETVTDTPSLSDWMSLDSHDSYLAAIEALRQRHILGINTGWPR